MSSETGPVVLVSDGIAHPGPLARAGLRAALARAGAAVDRTIGLTKLPTVLADAGAEARFGSDDSSTKRANPLPSLVILYYHRKNTPQARAGLVAALERYLRDGGAVIAFHAVTASFKSDDEYAALLGGRFVGHPPFGRFTVEPIDPLPGAPTEPCEVTDERYEHEFVTEISEHARAGGQPLVWSRRIGAGALVYISFGHRARVFASVPVRRTIAAAVRFLASACGSTA